MNQNHVFIQFNNLDELCLTSMLDSPLISQQVINDSKKQNDKRRKQYIACRYLLAKLLNQHFYISSLPNIIIGDNSRPRFEKNNLPDFNISHSDNYVAVAICSQGNVGIDIELKRPRKNYLSIAKQFFSPQENQWLNVQSDPLNSFWQLWTLRESVLKLHAKGVWQMKEVKISMPSQLITAKFGMDFYPYYQQLEAIHLSFCCNKQINHLTLNK